MVVNLFLPSRHNPQRPPPRDSSQVGFCVTAGPPGAPPLPVQLEGICWGCFVSVAPARARSPGEFICCFRMGDGLNTKTRRADIAAGVPVLGLRPTRSPFLRTTNEPKELSFTVSPRSKVAAIVSRTWLTSVLEAVSKSVVRRAAHRATPSPPSNRMCRSLQ